MVIDLKIVALIKIKLKKKENYFLIKTNKNSISFLNYLVHKNIICYYTNYKQLRHYRTYKIKLSKIKVQKANIFSNLTSNVKKHKPKN